LLTKTLPLFLAGLLVLFLYLYFFVGISNLIETIQKSNLYVYSFGIFLAFVDMILYSLTWHYFIRALSMKVAFKKTFSFTWIAFLVDFIIPSESVTGDLTKIYLMSNELEGRYGKVAASVIIQRIVFTVINLGSFVIGSAISILFHYKLPQQAFNLIVLMIILTSISLVILVLLYLKRRWMEGLLDWGLRLSEFLSGGRLKREEWKPKATSFIESFYSATAIFGENPGKIVLPLLFSVSAWIVSLLMCFVSFLSLGYYIPFTTVIIVYSIGIAIQYVPFGVPGEIGLTEIVMTSIFSLFGIPPDVSAAGTILSRFLTTWLKLIVGFVAAEFIGIKGLISKISRQ